MSLRSIFVSSALIAAFGAQLAPAQTIVPGSKSTAHAPALTAGEARATRAFNAAKALGRPELYAFLKPMPKGGDLHMHLSGAVYAETFIAEAIRQGLCVAPVDSGTPAVPEGQNAVHLVQPVDGKGGNCAAGQVPAADALKRQPLYDDLIDSFSMRAFVPTEGIDGHDQFFATFDRFGGLKDYSGEWLDEVATRAAAQNEQYLEVMQTPTFSHAAALGNKLGWPADVLTTRTTSTMLAKLRDQLLASGLREEVTIDRQQFAEAQALRLRIEHDRAKDPRMETLHIRSCTRLRLTSCCASSKFRSTTRLPPFSVEDTLALPGPPRLPTPTGLRAGPARL